MDRKLLLGSLAGLGAFVLAAVAAAPFLVPTGGLRGEIEGRVAHATGRAFRINGALTFSLFPVLGFDARDVTLANVPGGHARDIVHVDAMRIAVKPWPLLSGRIEASEIVLDRPTIALEVSADGTANWRLVQAHTEKSGLRVPANTVFAGVTIHDGSVSYDNDRLNIHRAISALDARIALTRLALPVTVQGHFVHRGQRLDFKVTVGTLKTLLAGQATQTDLSVTSMAHEARFKGTVSSDGTAMGWASLRTVSLWGLSTWLGHPMTANRGLADLVASADITAKDHSVTLRNIRAKLDDMTIRGTLTADMRGKVPLVDGALAIDHLDLNTYLGLGGVRGRSYRPRGPPSGGWSKTPIRLDLIKLVNGRLALTVGAISLLHLKTGRATIVATLQDGLMTAHLNPLQLYGSSGSADLTVDGRGAVPQIANRLSFSGIAMKPFLTDTIGVDKLEGRGSIVLDIAANGASPDAVMRTLSGKGSVSIAQGSVHGVDMGRVARTVETILSAGATGESATTDFDRFGGSFTIQNGILWNGDLKLDSAFLHMTGQGHLDLGNQTIAYTIVPKASIGGRMDLLDVGVPFAITGPWSHVHYRADLAGAVTGLLGNVLKGGGAPIANLLRQLAGGTAGKPPPGKKKHNAVGDALKHLFGLH